MEKDLRRLMAAYGTAFKKAYGQNFLSDEDLLAEIADGAGITDKDTVIEIGCGAGALTRALALRAKRVIGYEIDLSLKPLLKDVLSDYSNVELAFKDVMKEKLSDIERNVGGEYKIVANLPYYITTPVVMRFIEGSDKLLSMTVMVQKEVAERFAAKPSSSDYGAITVGIELRGNAKIIKEVPREKFTPVPNVDSAVVRIDIEANKNVGVDFSAVRETVKAGFSSRRKMLVNNLMNFYGFKREKAEAVLAAADIPLTARGETLSADSYIKLTEAIKNARR